ncbi:hypothetical protein BO70DRAFT_305088 [Aspergillus heteromorphus CBS 117.55]|uniref:U3 small nucleolar RNA-associated protein 11 n=1 Tax=Aspergillus heteromorphus CBS 117.55 TaxID=1448321 RepID=A0A317X3C8_9EURO|nr:uncharacterized protein BO70DRAFT_305088 [Aspergillus heteromorphus CBS 117.55]PWY92007.1 hypothetical protein BO70DRAFT_305088 [Aspergillus heteromorphus CBS 117.55]
MSSMRNAVQRRNHRERGQLAGREKWGILEKHKDYSLRAKDYNNKKAKIKRLEEKVRERNPDEFAFGMLSEGSGRKGKHGAGATRDSAAARGLSHDAIKLYKTQDAGYLRTVGERVRRQLEKAEEELRLQDSMKAILGGGKGVDSEDDDDMDFDDEDDFDLGGDDEGAKKGRKVVFADDRTEQRSLKKKRLQGEEKEESSDEEESFGDKQKKKTSLKQAAADRLALVEARRARKMKKRAAEVRENKVKSLQKQYKDITAAERELDWQRGRMDNVVGGTNKNGVKWKIRERKR